MCVLLILCQPLLHGPAEKIPRLADRRFKLRVLGELAVNDIGSRFVRTADQCNDAIALGYCAPQIVRNGVRDQFRHLPSETLWEEETLQCDPIVDEPVVQVDAEIRVIEPLQRYGKERITESGLRLAPEALERNHIVYHDHIWARKGDHHRSIPLKALWWKAGKHRAQIRAGVVD